MPINVELVDPHICSCCEECCTENGVHPLEEEETE